MSSEIQNLTEPQTEIPTEVTSTSDPVVVEIPAGERQPAIETAQIKQQLTALANDPIGRISAVLEPYKPFLIVLGYLLLAIIGVKLVFSLLGAILGVVTSLPMIAPLMQLIGVGYTGWFIYRYLLTAHSRQELFQKVSQVKQDLLGRAES